MNLTQTFNIDGNWQKVASTTDDAWVVHNADIGTIEIGLFDSPPAAGVVGHPLFQDQAASAAVFGVGDVWVRSQNGVRGSRVIVTAAPVI